MKESNKIVLKDLYRFIKPYKFWFILAAILNLSLISSNLLRTYYTEKLLDNATRSELSGLLTYLGVLLVLTCAALIMVYGIKYAAGRFGSMLVRELRYGVFKRLSHSNIKEIDKLSVGDIISRSNYEMDFISRFLERGVSELLFQPLMFIAASVYMIIIDWRLFLICYSLSPIAIFLINKFDEKSIGQLIAYSQLILFVADPINTLAQLFGGVRKFFVAFKRVRELLDVETEGYLHIAYNLTCNIRKLNRRLSNGELTN